MTEKIVLEMVLYIEGDDGWNGTLTDLKTQIKRAIVRNIEEVADIELDVVKTERIKP